MAAVLCALPASAFAQTLTFEHGCTAGTRVRIAAVGDLLFHNALQRRALTPTGTYRQFWQPVQPVLDAADIVYGNLEGPAAEGVTAGGIAVKDPGRTFDGRVYGMTPGALVFNFHPSVIADLKVSRFSVVSTANNHAADRGALGIDRTIDGLRRAGIAFTGTRKRDEPDARWSTVTSAKGLTIGWLACTYSTNGMPDRGGQVLNCYRDREVVMGELRRLAADPVVDAVILTPHWGHENTHQPLASDRAYARAAIDAGADAVLGAHPHVLQPWEKHVTQGGRDGLIVYSLGNFISNQQRPAQRSGVIALIDVVKGEGQPKARIAAAGFVPTWVDFPAAGHRVTDMKGDGAAKHAPLAATLQVLPRGNRVTGATLDTLPRPPCPEMPIALAPPSEPLPKLALLGPVAAPDLEAPKPSEPVGEPAAPQSQPQQIVETPVSEPPIEIVTAAASLPVVVPLMIPFPAERQPPPSGPNPPRVALRVERRQPGAALTTDDPPTV